ncbi:DEAD/DEAH box helicase [Persicimonas caeni]|uniref:DEAD/DEAH box helicase n=1 Tax=Persicimonas caeni TaxID=2292766 RepID=UPI001C9B8C18|nr:DEAD/DEAH box helicase [Persicimonas caeni]
MAKPRAHPFAASAADLRAALANAAPLAGLGEFEAGEFTLLLPSTKDGPQASPGLVRDEDVDAVCDRLSPWTVPALSLNRSAAISLLDELSEELGGVQLGDSVHYWRAVAALADEFVRAGRLLPGLEVVDNVATAVWRPLPATAEDFARLQALREAMPPMARASVTESMIRSAKDTGWEAAEVPSTRRVLISQLGKLVDTLVRDRLADSDAQRSPAPSGSAHQRWVHALASRSGTLDASSNDVAALSEDLEAWTQPLRATQERGLRLCFRLSPPDPDANPSKVDAAAEIDEDVVSISRGAWRIDFLLQAADDPSLLVEAEVAWHSTGKTLQVLERYIEHPQEALLEELGRALRLFPALEDALHEARPTRLEVSAGEAYEFLSQYAPVLEQSGFGIIVPAWWDEPERRLGAKLETRSKSSSDPQSSGSGLGARQLLDFHWKVALGDEELSKEELERLAELKMPLVRVRGQWVSLRPEDIERALRLFEQGEGGEMTAAEAIRAGLGLEEAAERLPVVAHEFGGWLGELLEQDFEEQLAAAKTPEKFDGTLRPYQERGLAWLCYLERLGFGACLADDMGLGKTIQVLARMVEERAESTSPGTTLLVCPLSVVGNWKHEAHKFAPELDVYVHHGPERRHGDVLQDAIAEADLVVTTYGVVRSDVDELRRVDWHRVVLDEAQKIKNSSAGRTQAVRALSARHRIALTGTPVENKLLELWSIMHFLNPGLLGSAKAFHEKLAKPIEVQGDERKAEILRRLTGPFILRRLKTDERIISDLPEKIEIKEYCNLTREQTTLYKAVVDEMLERIKLADDMERRGLVLAMMTRLKQVCNHPAQFLQDGSSVDDRSGKLDRLENLAQEILDAGDKALIFTQYTEMGRLIRQQLQRRLGKRVLYLHGGTPQKKRDEMVERFQSPDGPPFFLLSLHAGGTGLTLTAASHVIHYDRWWNPAVEDQATDRAFRIGQTSNVQVRKFICEGTLEEKIDQIIERKKNLADQVLTDGEAWLTELTTDELRELVELSEEALT